MRYRNRLRWAIPFVLLFLMTSLPSVFNNAYAQTNIGLIDITDIDFSSFPVVNVQARVIDQSGVQIQALSDDDLLLSENGEPVAYDHQAVDAGVQVAFVIDGGIGINSIGATGASRLDEIKSIVRGYITGMGEHDSALIILQSANQTTLIQSLTADRELLNTAINLNEFSPLYGYSFALDAVQLGLDELSSVSGVPKSQSLVLFSSGIQISRADYLDVEQYALLHGIPVHTILVRPTETSDAKPGMERLAQNTNGIYTHFTLENDTDDLFAIIEMMRTQYLLTFRSSDSSTAERTLDLGVNEGGPNAARDFAKYTVDLLPPQVIVQEPTPGSQIVRQISATGNYDDPFAPTQTTISVQVNWPDGYARGIELVDLYIDSVLSGNYVRPSGDVFTFDWDLRVYRTPGSNSTQLTVSVTDELGIVGQNVPAQYSINVPLPPEPCEGLSGWDAILCKTSDTAGTAALFIAGGTFILFVVASVLMYRNRDKLISAGERIGDVARDAWDRVTGGTREKPAAYMEVLTERYRDDLGVSIPIYRSAPTTIGRNPYTNKIVIPDQRDEPEVSREHCKIHCNNVGNWFLTDYKSTSGTVLEGRQIEPGIEEPIVDGDEITLGRLAYGGVRFRFLQRGPGAGETELDEENRATN